MREQYKFVAIDFNLDCLQELAESLSKESLESCGTRGETEEWELLESFPHGDKRVFLFKKR